MEKLIVLAVLWCSQAAFALQAPFLYTADSASDTSVQLTWRNNSTAYLGVIVLRKTALAAPYTVADTAPGTATSLTDVVKPAAQTTYYYALTAYSQTEHADTSSGDSVRITPPKIVGVFAAPSRVYLGWDTLSHVVSVNYLDSSNTQNGHRIFRSTNFGPFVMIKDLSSLVESPIDYWYTVPDSTVNSNTWYMYYVVTYKGQQTLSSVSDTVFTFDVNAMKRSSPKKCTVLGEIGSFPIHYGSWCLKSGDTIALTEAGAPDSSFTIIDVSNPSQPRFAGLGKSGAAVIHYYPSSRPLAAYTKANYIFKPDGDSLWCYRYQSGTVSALSTINLGRMVLPPCGFLSDSTLIVPDLVDTIGQNLGGTTGVSYMRANEVLFKNNVLSNSRVMPVYRHLCGDQFPCDYSSSPSLSSGIVYQGRLFTGLPGNNGFIQTMEVLDFNFPASPTTVFGVNSAALPFLDLQVLSTGVSVYGIDLTNARSVLVDTVKNLVFALSDSQLSVYNCQIAAGVSRALPSVARGEQSLRFGKGTNGLAPVLLLPPHTQPVSVSVFDMSGRRLAHLEGIQGETAPWPAVSRTGVYIVRAVLDGKSVSARVVLTK